MNIYEKPTAELVKFESESILLTLNDVDVGDMPIFSSGSEEW